MIKIDEVNEAHDEVLLEVSGQQRTIFRTQKKLITEKTN